MIRKENKMYFFKKAIKHKNTFAKISAAICLVLGAALLLISSGGNVAYPVLAQVMGILLLTFSVYVAIAYLLREYTYSVEPNKHIADDSISEQYDFIITEAKGNRNVKVCHIEISDIRLVRVVDPTNRKQVRGERKTLVQLFETMKSLGYKGGKVRLSHSYNPEAALAFKALILDSFPNADISVALNRGLCCFYAEEGGLLAGFEG